MSDPSHHNQVDGTAVRAESEPANAEFTISRERFATTTTTELHTGQSAAPETAPENLQRDPELGSASFAYLRPERSTLPRSSVQGLSTPDTPPPAYGGGKTILDRLINFLARGLERVFARIFALVQPARSRAVRRSVQSATAHRSSFHSGAELSVRGSVMADPSLVAQVRQDALMGIIPTASPLTHEDAAPQSSNDLVISSGGSENDESD